MEHSPYYCGKCNEMLIGANINEWYYAYMGCLACADDCCAACAKTIAQAFYFGSDHDLANAIHAFRRCSDKARSMEKPDTMVDTGNWSEPMATFEGGGRRSSDEGKPRFDLLLAPDMPYEQQFLYRFAMSMTEGAQRYGEHNYANMTGEDALSRAKASLFRHVMQYLAGETDEDHAARIASNLLMLSKIEHNIQKGDADGTD